MTTPSPIDVVLTAAAKVAHAFGLVDFVIYTDDPCALRLVRKDDEIPISRALRHVRDVPGAFAVLAGPKGRCYLQTMNGYALDEGTAGVDGGLHRATPR